MLNISIKDRPRVRPEITASDRIAESAGWAALILFWAMIAFSYSSLPAIIPTHFNGAGIADGYGPKPMILILPVMATFMFVGMTILGRFPHIYNYPIRITEENSLRQYTYATRMFRYLKLGIVLLMGLLAYKTIHATAPQIPWLLPATLALVFVPVVIYIVMSFRAK